MSLLAYRSAMFPTIVGIALMVGSVAWLLDPVLTFIPGVPDVVREIVSIPTSIAEFGLILYLLIVGIRMPAAIPEQHSPQEAEMDDPFSKKDHDEYLGMGLGVIPGKN